jgi:glycosyltransferase involved in cell wall biosynthesis
MRSFGDAPAVPRRLSERYAITRCTIVHAARVLTIAVAWAWQASPSSVESAPSENETTMAASVTIIVPNFNHARFLSQRLDSILAQTFKDYELIVLDDASTDGSGEVLAHYAKQAPIHLVMNEKNSGSPFIQWRRGAQLASGKYLWIAESDDYADPRLLEVLVSEIHHNPNVGLAYCQSFSVDERGQLLGIWEDWREPVSDRWNHSYVNKGRDEVARFFVQRNTIPNASAVLVRKDLLLQATRHVEWMRLCGDWLTWARVLMRADVAFVAEPLNYFRSHGRSVRDTTKLARIFAEELCVKGYICSQVPVSPALLRRLFHGTANTAWFLLKTAFKRISPVVAAVRVGKHIVRRYKMYPRRAATRVQANNP